MSSIFSNFSAYCPSGENIGKIAKGGSKIASKVSRLAIKFFINKPLVAATLAFTALALWGKHKYSKLEKELADLKATKETLTTERDQLQATNTTLTEELATSKTAAETLTEDSTTQQTTDATQALPLVQQHPPTHSRKQTNSAPNVPIRQSSLACIFQGTNPFKIIEKAILQGLKL